MVCRILFFLALIIAGVLASAEIPAQSNSRKDIFDLIKAITRENQTSDSIPEADADNTSTGLVLDFLTNVYEGHGFYQSGNWDDSEDFTYITSNIKLPPYDRNDFYRPVMGRITSTYGYRMEFGRLHKGVDLSLNVGDTVRAAIPGVVAKVGYDAGGYGNYVVMVHNNGLETRYAHLSGALAVPGRKYDAGEAIALGGNTGNSTGPHLHFEVRYRGTAVDPMSVFDFHLHNFRISQK